MSDAPAEPFADPGAPALRRRPSQRRSRERVERILAAAVALIEARGSDALRMSELAERAGVSIGSLYQYFPDKAAVVRTLAERYNEEGRACIAAELAGVRDAEGLRRAFGGLIDTYYALFLAEPVRRDVWSATQADPALRAFELAESRANAAIVAAVLARLDPAAAPEALSASALTVMQLGEAAMRLAVSVERAEGDRLVDAYKRMALAELARAAVAR
ncbi:transcriptional regulator, TetR family [Tistlia consotensis]|uniref:Transcriptional regulator, TetR family n=1 Tax=Tistlia consotensis USBA 355 TaxID=560819 RepID=A0A1Y6CCU6_9PROT|nr:TetR/AcrR family transcriptional regulator [Tistlia consotensis]SMF48207.1 transcriptional regulator, TetR family [Tistlia consotensis USBA 355]SNR81642.1 transcriptional regulator, TetR family [Tistlia consotensis]